MSSIDYVILFIFGLAIGSFLNVVALRYDGDHFLFDPKMIGGRSHCPHCKTTLRWFELFPLFSFLFQGGKCRTCKVKLGIQYPMMELLSGIIFVAVPLRFSFVSYLVAHPSDFLLLSALWIVVFEVLLLISYIDILLGIIPDELNLALLVVGFLDVFFLAKDFGIGNSSFFGIFAVIFGLQTNVWINHLVGALFGVIFFGALVAVTRGRGMGMGDVKFALPLGLLFGWPDILIIAMIAFILGGGFGLIAIFTGKKTMKSAVPFGPFLVVAVVIAFFWGSFLLNGYLHIMGI